MLVVARDAQVGQLSEPGTSFLYQAKVLMLHEIGELVKALIDSRNIERYVSVLIL